MSIRSFATTGILAGVFGILAAACSAAPENTTNEPAATSGSEALTNSCLPKFCMTGHHWSQSLCECVPNCHDVIDCKVDDHWDPETCLCAPDCHQVEMCMAWQHFDSSVCHCVY